MPEIMVDASPMPKVLISPASRIGTPFKDEAFKTVSLRAIGLRPDFQPMRTGAQCLIERDNPLTFWVTDMLPAKL